MVTPGPASIVVVLFPFSDLSDAKLRPALVLANAGRGDWILCQITSNPHSDPQAVKLTPAALSAGALANISFARPTKLFTTHESLMNKRVAILRDETFQEIVQTIIETLTQTSRNQAESRRQPRRHEDTKFSSRLLVRVFVPWW